MRAGAVAKEAGTNSKERILEAATLIAQAHGYGGLNLRDLADQVGIKAASLYHHFANKAELGAAVARRYWEDTAVGLDALLDEAGSPAEALRRYPEMFRKALVTGNRICLCSFMAAESEDLPEPVLVEVRTFADVNVAWLERMLKAAKLTKPADNAARARAIFAAIAGAQLIARSRGDVAVYDTLVEGYRAAGLLPK
ncbi:TetR/AcrR family transcriptional regulator [Burkholderia gladioli]|nr:TetR/AcrR family transcriptional regulator [Burkholderia gladioli]